MQINITGQHIEVTPALRDYVNEKLERVENHFENIIEIRVILSVVKETQQAEATIKVPGKSLFADASDQDMYAAIDALTDKLDRQVRRYKDKLTDHHRNERPKGEALGGG